LLGRPPIIEPRTQSISWSQSNSHQPPAPFAFATSRSPAGLVPALNFSPPSSSYLVRHQPSQPFPINPSPSEHLLLPSKFHSHKHLGISFNNQLKVGYPSPDLYGVPRSGQFSFSNYSRPSQLVKRSGIDSLSDYRQAKTEPSNPASPHRSYAISGTQASHIGSSQRTEAISGSVPPHLSFPSNNNNNNNHFYYSMSDTETLAAVQASAQDVAQNALATTADLAPQQMDSPEQMDSGFEPFSPRRGHTHKRNEEPPKNDQGKMVCKFQKTQCPQAIFDRKCEWRYVFVILIISIISLTFIVNTWISMRGHINVKKLVARSSRDLHILVDFSDINEKCTRCMAVPKKHFTVLTKTANVTRDPDSRARKTCRSMFAEFTEGIQTDLKSLANQNARSIQWTPQTLP
jgi:hypothetical protein